MKLSCKSCEHGTWIFCMQCAEKQKQVLFEYGAMRLVVPPAVYQRVKENPNLNFWDALASAVSSPLRT